VNSPAAGFNAPAAHLAGTSSSGLFDDEAEAALLSLVPVKPAVVLPHFDNSRFRQANGAAPASSTTVPVTNAAAAAAVQYSPAVTGTGLLDASSRDFRALDRVHSGHDRVAGSNVNLLRVDVDAEPVSDGDLHSDVENRQQTAQRQDFDSPPNHVFDSWAADPSPAANVTTALWNDRAQSRSPAVPAAAPAPVIGLDDEDLMDAILQDTDDL